MSDSVAKLVLGLIPSDETLRDPGGRCRHVLLALAVNADDDGVARISVNRLCRQTGCAPAVIREGIRYGVQQSVLAVDPGPGTVTYRFDVAALTSLQQQARNRARDSIYVLLDFGVPEKTLNALNTCHTTLTELGNAIAEYNALPDDFRTGFHRYLDARNFGAAGARQVIDAYAEYRRVEALREHYDHADTSAEMEAGQWITPGAP